MTNYKEALKLHVDAAVLLSFVLKKDKAFLFTYPEKQLSEGQRKKFSSLVKKRVAGWPVAYLIGEKEFFGLNFLVNKNVLIPRPETETLVELVLSSNTYHVTRSKILDIGTGSGCLIIALAKTLGPKSKFFASDISKTALEVAKKNARKHKVKITFKQGDLLKPWKKKRFDIIVANLPYLPKLSDPSIKFEPKTSLVAKKQGLGLIEELLKQISTINPAPSTLFLEFDPSQKSKIKNLARKYLPDYEIKIFKDLAGKPRFACLQI